ncbi:hypothetical protein Q73_04640 [Bacillus coahuilensis m2-6]|uniref:DUF2922 domain-containing protein n=1 Tax=Bacillus coahuilensis p1.1.43 TaxID=1150625 RepID=A0A147KA96_9BACI|nr:DUF2922 domain-containing protein [Bacillus coahuilensis]KUP07625.1 hypothetical protein Q75_05200 [Bacillus coahuilensis p1.1.43]KUP08771.1 hypothetical protein Q73_04640 [Bacillus coahuilensis m2-6]
MAKVLELQFLNNAGKTTTVSIDEPNEPINASAVKNAMETIIASTVFQTYDGPVASIKGARLVDRTVTSYELV